MRLLGLWMQFLAAFAKPLRENSHKGSSQEEESARPSIELSGMREEKLAATIEWSKPENIALRVAQAAEDAPKVKAAGEALKKKIRESLSLPEDDPPMPDAEQLPKHMRGQSESTIRAMLRHESYEFDRETQTWKKRKLHIVG